MAARVLDDVLKNTITFDSLAEWLLNSKPVNCNDVLFKNYECSQVQFISYFLTYLREQTSRNFQVYDAETPRKNTPSRKSISSNCVEKNSGLLSKKPCSGSTTCLDLESLQSFPNLSSSSSCQKQAGSDRKLSDSGHQISSSQNSCSRDNNNAERKSTRVKLFSETLDGGSFKANSSKNEDSDIWVEFDSNGENKFAVSTPKVHLRNPSLLSSPRLTDEADESPKGTVKLHWSNSGTDLSSPEIGGFSPANKSFSAKTRGKTNSRVSLGDFIINESGNGDGRKEKKGKPKKRISATRVLTTSDTCQSGKSDIFTQSPKEVNNFSPVFGAKGKVEKIDRHVEGNMADKPANASTPGRQPLLESATHSSELKLLAKIYSFLMANSFCQNIMIELCFIVGLLVIQDCDRKGGEDRDFSNFSGNDFGKFFTSIDNCVFFAVETLWLQRACLLNLNLSALKMLSENVRIGVFNGELKRFLETEYSARKSKEESKRLYGFEKTGIYGNVFFQSETDSRENFPSDMSFHSFKKQRDLFYNILAVWEANHLSNGWIFSVGLGSKIRALLGISGDPINLLHLARLFRNQLVISCCGESQNEEELNEKILELLPKADPNKISRLRARLTSSPKRQGGPRPVPDFLGHQEFYKDFIVYTSNSVFHVHLKNSLCDEILRLNEAHHIGETEDEGSAWDEVTQERYLQCVNILRLLAKFLGFVEFLPYRGEKMFSERISNIHCSVRNNILPLFDVTECLESAAKNGNLILTVPWIVSFLSMIDCYSARLKVYRKVWRRLILIYKHLKAFTSPRNAFYLKLLLGWTFQLPNFPPDQFYGTLDDGNKSSAESPSADTVGSVGGDFSRDTFRLDTYDFMEESALYTICPFLNEINVILRDDSGCSVRHVRPVTTQETDLTKSQASRQLQLRLEGNFLHNQSSSTRKTVEFVTERVASITIKHLIHETVPKVKEIFWTELEKSSPSDLKEAEAFAENLSESCHRRLIADCKKENSDFTFRRSDVAVKALLSSDLQVSVAETCTKIVARQAAEKVDRWMLSHFTPATVKKEFVAAARKTWARKYARDDGDRSQKTDSAKNAYRLAAGGRGVPHLDAVSPASRALKSARESICRIREGDVCPLRVRARLREIAETVRHRNDVIPAAEKALVSFALDLVVIFCIHSSGNDLNSVLDEFAVVLGAASDATSHSSLERIMCQRNLAIISHEAQAEDKAWRNLVKLLFFLLEKGFLEKEHLETQFLSWFRHTHAKEEKEQFGKFLSDFLHEYAKVHGCDKLTLLLEYLMENLDDDEPASDEFT